ncbi:skin secretory protein xP2-like [Erythrolamprus reginae]|uniref:skin secretory protein xP2-like n=1 Tax=Erythrolamprus reginae TaxID=121349 RepID=UPI00396C834F
MEGALLHLFFLLVASRGGSGQQLGDLCYPPMKGPRADRVAFHCPGLQDPADARFCCGTCSQPFCCASQGNSLEPTKCPALDPVPEATNSTPPTRDRGGGLSLLWCFTAVLVGIFVVWALCRSCTLLRWPRVCRCDEEEEEQPVVELEERRSPIPLGLVLPPMPPMPPMPPSPPPSPPLYTDLPPPPYSDIDRYPSVPVSASRAPPEPGPPEGATPSQLRGAVGGARSRIRGAEGGVPAGFPGAEEGAPAPPYPDDPPPYSALDFFAAPSLPPPMPRPSRRKRRAKVAWVVEEALAEPARAVGGAPAEPPEPAGAVGGAPAEPPEPAGAVGGAPAEPPEPAGAVGGAPAEPPEPAGAVGGAPAEASGAEGGPLPTPDKVERGA